MNRLLVAAVLSGVLLASPAAFAQQTPDASAGSNGAKGADSTTEGGGMKSGGMKSGGMMKKSKKKHHHHM